MFTPQIPRDSALNDRSKLEVLIISWKLRSSPG